MIFLYNRLIPKFATVHRFIELSPQHLQLTFWRCCPSPTPTFQFPMIVLEAVVVACVRKSPMRSMTTTPCRVWTRSSVAVVVVDVVAVVVVVDVVAVVVVVVDTTFKKTSKLLKSCHHRRFDSHFDGSKKCWKIWRERNLIEGSFLNFIIRSLCSCCCLRGYALS